MAHNSSILLETNVESFPGKGTMFTVLIPALEEDFTPEKIEDAISLPYGQERILVVDDEPLSAEMVQEMLTTLGYEAIFRTGGMAALEAFMRQPTEKPFDLVITDMTMPHFTGVDLANEISGLHPEVPVIVMTGFSKKIDADKAKDLGIHGFLMKPVAMEQLSTTVRTVLDRRTI